MKQLFSRVSQILTGLLLGIALFFSTGFGLFGQQIEARGQLLTVDTSSYRVDPDNTRPTTDAQSTKYKGENPNPDLIENSRKQLKDAADNAREKVSLDQPSQNAKDFLNAVQDKIEQVIKPE